MDYSDNRGAVALARRFFIHLRAGGQITPEDMGLIVESLERRDAALAPILRHADAPDTAPPLRLSVEDCREIASEVSGR